MQLKWTASLSALPLCGPGEGCTDQYMVNAAAISDDGSRVVACTYYQNYLGTTRTRVDGTYGLYVYDTAGSGTRIFADEYNGDRGVYDVAMSGDGTLVAGGGVLTDGGGSPFTPKRGIVRAFDVPTRKVLLDSTDFPDRVSAIALSHDGSVLAAVAAFSLYVFIRDASGMFSSTPYELRLDGYSDAVDVHPSGRWLAAADRKGTVYVFTITAGVVNPPAKWIAEEPVNPEHPASRKEPVKLHRICAARSADALVAAGDDYIYLLTPASVQSPTPGPVARFSTFDAAGHHKAWGVAIADDGSFLTAVVNDDNPAGFDTGRLMKLSLTGSVLTKDWQAALDHLPNSTSIDSSGTRITACDGYPVFVPGKFYLFDDRGVKLGEHQTVKMCWPIVISPDGTGIVGGDDDNSLFFFTP